MKPKRAVWISLILMLILSVITITPNVTMAFPTVISVNPSINLNIPPNEDFTIQINIANVTDLNFWEVKLQYNPEVLYISLITEGPFLQESEAGLFYLTDFNVFTGPYYVLVGCMFMGPVGASGSGILAYITFGVQKRGASDFHLYDTKLFDSYYPTPGSTIAHTRADGYFSNCINVVVKNVIAFPTIASVGESVSINATVRNESNITETFDVTVYYNSTTIGTQTVTSLNLGASATLTFNWDTVGLAAGIYIISANASFVEGETYTADNGFVDGGVRLTTNPAARFTFSPSIPTPGQIVTFNASESFSPNGDIISYEWNFGDGNTTAVTTPVITHAYNSFGIYTVSLNVTDEVWKWDIRSKTVTVGFPPEASFTFSPVFPLPSQIVTFNASGSSASNGAIISYKWNFGDGNTTTVATPVITHAYNSFGIYTVTLNVIDNLGMGDVESQSVTVGSLPTASFAFSPVPPIVNEIVTFNASASFDSDGSIVKYVWDFGDGETGTGNIITHVYTSFGAYSVTLNVTDNDEFWDTEAKTVSVKSLPTASFTFSPSTPKVNEIVTFNASASFDPDGSIVSYKWGFGDGGTGTGKIATHVYTSFGTYTVTLNVTDTDGLWDIETKTVSVKSLPTASFTFSPSTPKVNEIVTFDASGSSDPDGSIVSFKWDFGDGNVTTVSSSTVTHVYAASQSYTVTLTVTDNEGFTNVQTQTVLVEEAPQTNVLLYVGVAVIIVIAATLLFYFGRRKH